MTLKQLLWSTVILFILVSFVVDIWNEKRLLGYNSKEEQNYFIIIALTIISLFIISLILLCKTIINL